LRDLDASLVEGRNQTTEEHHKTSRIEAQTYPLAGMPSVVTDDACDVTFAYTSRDPPSLSKKKTLSVWTTIAVSLTCQSNTILEFSDLFSVRLHTSGIYLLSEVKAPTLLPQLRSHHRILTISASYKCANNMDRSNCRCNELEALYASKLPSCKLPRAFTLMVTQ
jgi:hypothetical protein